MKHQAFDLYLPSGEYIPDGEPRVFDGRVYVYGSHDRDGGDGFFLNGYVTWCAPVNELRGWQYEGIVFRKEQDSENPDRHPLFDPDVVRGADSRYYLYYSPIGTEIIGVAVCDTPIFGLSLAEAAHWQFFTLSIMYRRSSSNFIFVGRVRITSR